MAMGSVLDGTPKWFQRLVMPVIATVVVVIPMTVAWANVIMTLEQLQRHDTEIAKLVDDLESYVDNVASEKEEEHQNFRDTVQRYEVKQAVMDEKLDRVLDAINELKEDDG